MPYWAVPEEMTSFSNLVLSLSSMQLRTDSVVTMTSTAGTRPWPSALGTRRWEMTPRSTEANCRRICFWWWGGKTEITRLMVSVASRVCRGAEDQVARLGGVEGGLDGLQVAHLAHE